MTLYPWGYDQEKVSYDTMVTRLRKHTIHPEYERRLLNWIVYQHGNIGIGSGWRDYNNDVSGASSANKSFHQTQTFMSGLACYSAVDLVAVNPGHVHRAPSWSEVPEQGSDEAKKWGVHCNVNGEPWHMQCIEMDGFDSWVNGGRKDPQANYPIPGTEPEPEPPTSYEDDDMLGLDFGSPGFDSWWTRLTYTGDTVCHVVSPADQLQQRGGVKIVKVDETELNALLDSVMTVGPSPFHEGGQAPNSVLHTKWEQARGRT